MAAAVPRQRPRRLAQAAEQRAALLLALVAALQLLPARQRAALVLRDVLDLPAAAVAQILGISVAAVNSSLQRARATLRTAAPVLEELREPADPDERAVVERYLAAFEAADVPGLARLLADDVVLEMPPVPLWLTGRALYREFMERVFACAGPVGACVPCRPTAAPPGPRTPRTRHRRGAGHIRCRYSFVDPSLFDVLGLASPDERPYV